MFSKLFEERDKTITYLVKLGDCIARSLRENMTLFSIDSQNSQVTYLTEGGMVISGNFTIGSDITLSKIKVQDSSIFEDTKQFDSFVEDKIHSFVEGIHYGEYSSADDSFSDILSLWENRLKLSSVQSRLHEKSSKLAEVETIIESSEFKQLSEVTPQLKDFLQENYKKIISVPEIRNAVNLSNAVSQAFNFPKITLETLVENKQYTLKEGVGSSIYDMVCRQELVKRELIESKKDFSTIWASNAAIRNLASMIFESDEQVVDALSEALKEVPYLSLASKKSLCSTFSNCLAQVDGIGVSEKDIQRFSSRIFEYKKEVKELFIETINEKYGVNIQNLQSPASFKSLANTQVVIFEALSRLSPKGTILKKVLFEMAQSLKNKSGVECIDINDYLLEMFISVGYDQIIEEGGGMKYAKIDFKRVSKDLEDVKDLIMTLKERVAADSEYESDENVDQTALAATEEAETPKPAPQPAAEAPGPAEMEEPPPADTTGEEIPPEDSQDEVATGLADLESMVADIAAEIGEDESGEEEKPKKTKKEDK